MSRFVALLVAMLKTLRTGLSQSGSFLIQHSDQGDFLALHLQTKEGRRHLRFIKRDEPSYRAVLDTIGLYSPYQ